MEEESLNLTKYLSTAGVASRRHAADLIKEGHVLVNGVVETNPAVLRYFVRLRLSSSIRSLS